MSRPAADRAANSGNRRTATEANANATTAPASPDIDSASRPAATASATVNHRADLPNLAALSTKPDHIDPLRIRRATISTSTLAPTVSPAASTAADTALIASAPTATARTGSTTRTMRMLFTRHAMHQLG